jgi:hypothetical protein
MFLATGHGFCLRPTTTVLKCLEVREKLRKVSRFGTKAKIYLMKSSFAPMMDEASSSCLGTKSSFATMMDEACPSCRGFLAGGLDMENKLGGSSFVFCNVYVSTKKKGEKREGYDDG